MTIAIRAAIAILSIASIGTAYADSEAGQNANTLFTQTPGFLAQVPVQSARRSRPRRTGRRCGPMSPSRATAHGCMGHPMAETAPRADPNEEPLAAERNRSMFAFLIAAGAVFLAVAVSAAINLAGPSQSR